MSKEKLFELTQHWIPRDTKVNYAPCVPEPTCALCELGVPSGVYIPVTLIIKKHYKSCATKSGKKLLISNNKKPKYHRRN